ncbi:hypothetical protein, partial [Lactobacillus johnsonii]|uniref:hypothetical protein n=1 Tax=Lactobacillus johnsonii TaxID=33959 RepID=UPI003659218C
AKAMWMYADHQRDLLSMACAGLRYPKKAKIALEALQDMGLNIPMPYTMEELGLTPEMVQLYKNQL